MKANRPSLAGWSLCGHHLSFVSLYVIALSSASIVCSAQLQLVKDINTSQDTYLMEYNKAVDCNGLLYFTSNQALWRTNGRTSGTFMLKRFDFIDYLSDMVSYGGAVYFYASQSGEGMELWRSKGASYSTVRLKDIGPGETGGDISQLTVSGKFLFFVANNGTHGKELWRTDGTSAGTMMVKDIQAKGGSSNPAFLRDVNGVLFFAANDGINGYELWKSDGTAQGTVMVKDIKTGTRLSSSPGQITNVNGIAFFTADDGVSGRELWKSDGSAAGTLLVKDFVPGAGSGNYRNLTGVENKLFFSANDKIHGEEVWKSDGTSAGTVMVKDLYPGGITKQIGGVVIPEPALRNFTSVYGKLYFTGFGPDGYYFWKTDGTAQGTIALKEANTSGRHEAVFIPYNGNVIFTDGPREQEAETFSYEIQKEDATGVITTLATLFLNDFYSSRIPYLVHSGNNIYFVGRQTLSDGYALFKNTGTAASTQIVTDAFSPTLDSHPSEFVKIGNDIYFTAYDGVDNGIWKTDGTGAGTLLIKSFYLVQGLTNVNGQLFFAGLNDGEGWHVYRSDGTPEGTKKIDYQLPDGPLSLINVNGTLFVTWGANGIMTTQGAGYNVYIIKPTIQHAFALGSYLYFHGTDATNGTELWRTNGTPLGTKLVKNINPNGNSDPGNFAALNDVLYFSANDGTHGRELWRSNGTSAGTYMVKDVRHGDLDGTNLGDITDIAAVDNHIYFFSRDENAQPALWKSGGSNSNTSKVTTVPTLSQFMISNSRMYFTSYASPFAYLWKSDGTAETTEQLGGGWWYSTVGPNVTVDGVFYSSLGGEIWRSDGTPCGTFHVPAVGGSPAPIEYLADELIFGAGNETTGRELYKVSLGDLPPSPCATPVEATILQENKIKNYPNPFTNSFTLEIPGGDAETYNIRIVDLMNNVYEVRLKLKYNESYRLGADLPQGWYVLKIWEGDKVTTMKIIKR